MKRLLTFLLLLLVAGAPVQPATKPSTTQPHQNKLYDAINKIPKKYQHDNESIRNAAKLEETNTYLSKLKPNIVQEMTVDQMGGAGIICIDDITVWGVDNVEVRSRVLFAKKYLDLVTKLKVGDKVVVTAKVKTIGLTDCRDLKGNFRFRLMVEIENASLKVNN